MIVVSRRRDEALVIGDDIIVTIVDIRGDKVRIGIEHPPEVPVHRQEVYEALRRQPMKMPPAMPAPMSPPPQPRQDKLDRFVAILEVKVGVPITRAVVIEALREAGLEAVFKEAAVA
jgi:carbon storage regulator